MADFKYFHFQAWVNTVVVKPLYQSDLYFGEINVTRVNDKMYFFSLFFGDI